MSAGEITSVILSVVATILAGVAIALSIVFYKMSSDVSSDTKEAAKDVGASVLRLEKLFETLYEGTFSLMKDTVLDIRSHAWPTSTLDETSASIEAKTEGRIHAVRDELFGDLKSISDKNAALSSEVSKLQNIVERAIAQTREAESKARRETLQERIAKSLAALPPTFEARRLISPLTDDFQLPEVLTELGNMKDARLLDWEGEAIGPLTLIRNTA